jgi:hypothetical protein
MNSTELTLRCNTLALNSCFHYRSFQLGKIFCEFAQKKNMSRRKSGKFHRHHYYWTTVKTIVRNWIMKQNICKKQLLECWPHTHVLVIIFRICDGKFCRPKTRRIIKYWRPEERLLCQSYNGSSCSQRHLLERKANGERLETSLITWNVLRTPLTI